MANLIEVLVKRIKFQELLSAILCQHHNTWFHVTLSIFDNACQIKPLQGPIKFNVHVKDYVDVNYRLTSDWANCTVLFNCKARSGFIKDFLKECTTMQHFYIFLKS